MKETKESMILFKDLWDTTTGILRQRKLTREELRKTWDLMKDFSFDQISKAMDEYLLKDKVFVPSPGELAALIRNSNSVTSEELESLTELRNIKSKFGTIENETYGQAKCHRCGGSGYVVLVEKRPPYYGAVFACNCWKGIPKSEKLAVFSEGLAQGYDYPDNIDYKKKEKENVNINMTGR